MCFTCVWADFWLAQVSTASPPQWASTSGSVFSRPELVRVQLCPPVGKVNHRMGVCILPPRLVINLVFSVTQGTKEGGQRSVRGMLPLGRHILPWRTGTTAHASGLYPRRTTLPLCFTEPTATARAGTTSAAMTSWRRRGFTCSRAAVVCRVLTTAVMMLRRRRKRGAARIHRKAARGERCARRRVASEASPHPGKVEKSARTLV